MNRFNHEQAEQTARLASETIRGDLRARLGHAPGSCALFTLMLLCGILVRAEGQTVGGFTNRYNTYGTNFICIAPWTAQGIFYEGDTVTISNRLGTTIEVYDYHFNPITNAPPPAILSNLGLGHYFVQVDGIRKGPGDRAQFIVLPRGYTNQPHADIGYTMGTIAEHYRFQRLAPGFSRFQRWWYQLPTDRNLDGIATAAGTNDWTVFSQVLQTYSNVPVKVLNVIVGHGYGYGALAAPPVDQTNTISSWVTDVALLYSNAAVKFGTNYIYEILNEPSGSNIIFTNTDVSPYWLDPYWATDPGVLPAAMAVSAAVQAVKFACSNCVTWAPASGGWRTLTDSFAVAYYTNADALSFHEPPGFEGPVDATCEYTNRSDLGTVLPIDAMDSIISGLHSGKELAVTECYPFAPDVLGKTNSWWLWNGGYNSTN